MTRRVALVFGTAIVAVLVGAPAYAIPGEGASPDTPGTSSSVSPRSLEAGDTIRFSVSGFPAGEVVSIKIDDGLFCSDSGVHGACVVHQQRIGSNGKVSGSFALPTDLKPGKHWLRYLASAEKTDAQGNYLGVVGYTLRDGSDFTVVKAAATKPATPSTAPATPPSAPAAPVTSSAAPPVADPVTPTPAPSTPTPSTPTPSTPIPDEEPTQAVAAPVRTVVVHKDAFPVVGSVGLAALLAASGGLVLWDRRKARG